MEILALIVSVVTLIAVVVIFLKLRAPKTDENANLMLQQQINASVQQINSQLNATNTALTNAVQQLNAQVTQNLQQTNAALVQSLQQTNQGISQRFDSLNASLTKNLQQSAQTMNERLDKAAQVVGDLREKVGQIHEVGKAASELVNILRAPKLRGGMGELFLGDLLAQILPPEHFALQHPFRSGEKVDAIIKIGSRVVPVDSKFPLENFKRVMDSASDAERVQARKKFNGDVKKHIDAIHDKYIRPDEGTYDFALMYIPAENVYYETIIKDDNAGSDRPLFSYALESRVIPVSPNSFYAYLQTILLGLKGMQVEQRAQEILSTLQRLRGDFEKVQENFRVLGTHLTNAQKQYGEAGKSLDKFDSKLTQIEQPQLPSGERKELE